MTSRAVTVGLVDGPLDASDCASQQWFCDGPADELAARHAGALRKAATSHAPDVCFKNAVIFGARLGTSRAAVIDALTWLTVEPPDIVHCSFGLPGIDGEIADRVAVLVEQGSVVVASAPARGVPVIPAALPGVIAVQGDARCGPVDLSWLATEQADFGAHVLIDGAPDVRGASAAAAHFTGHLAALLPKYPPADALEQLKAVARWRGPEHRR